MKFTFEERFKIFQVCSGNYLLSPVPDRWFKEMTDAEREQFLLDNRHDLFKNETAESLLSLIESAAFVIEAAFSEIIKDRGVTL